jgi:hypothetical protein
LLADRGAAKFACASREQWLRSLIAVTTPILRYFDPALAKNPGLDEI